MINGILYTTDFSEPSKEALKWSIGLAKMINAHLTILYTYRLLKQNGKVIEMKKNIEAEAQSSFRAMESELLIGSGIEYDFKTEVGFVADRVEDHLQKNNVSFLVISKFMTTDNKETFDDLVKDLRMPLVIVP